MAHGIFNTLIFNEDIFNTHEGLVLIGTPHPTQAFYTSHEQLIPICFIFKLKSCLVTRIKARICPRSTLRLPTRLCAKLKSILLVETKTPFKIKSAIWAKESVKISLASALTKPTIYSMELSAVARGKNIRKRKVRKVLLRKFISDKLKEMLDDG